MSANLGPLSWVAQGSHHKQGVWKPRCKSKAKLGNTCVGILGQFPHPQLPLLSPGLVLQESDSCEGEEIEGGLGRTNPQDVQGWQAVNLSKLCQDPGRKSRKVQSLWLHTPEVAAGTINLLPFLNL